jgi:hypothetical protein
MRILKKKEGIKRKKTDTETKKTKERKSTKQIPIGIKKRRKYVPNRRNGKSLITTRIVLAFGKVLGQLLDREFPKIGKVLYLRPRIGTY